MKLTRVNIKNFRSIKDITVSFDPTCRVLVGINESGKSNILRALAFLDEDIKPSEINDLREALPDESRITKSCIDFVFQFEKRESDELLDKFYSVTLSAKDNQKIICDNGKNKSIKEFCSSQHEGVYEVDIRKESRRATHWVINRNNFKILSGWKKPTSVCPLVFTVGLGSTTYQISNHKFIYFPDLPDLPEEYIEDVTVDDIIDFLENSIEEVVEKNIPDTLFWEYDEENLLPNKLNIDEFVSNPDMCIPLKNMFMLAGIEEADIGQDITSARSGSSNQFANYLNGIASKTTGHFRSVWKEYKTIKFSLRCEANQIIPGIKEKNTHDFERRSDGFKRFVTFLLMISMKVETGSISNTLLLVDEPEMSLHPSGARYLRDELIKISQKNYVIYSTHSIFMIDSDKVERHYIVKKKDEITSIEEAEESSIEESNIKEEEVLYKALGYSMFDDLEKENLIFEGWTDKKLFSIAVKGADNKLKKKFSNVGFCHAGGVKTIPSITSMIDLAKRGCIIISDSDKPAKQGQKKHRENKRFGDWKTYQDIDSTIEAETGEDFINNDFITKQVNFVLSDEGISNIPKFEESILPDKKEKLKAIYEWLDDKGISDDQAKQIINKIKKEIFENLKYEDINHTEYTKLLKGISFTK